MEVPGGVRLFDLQGLDDLSVVGLLRALYCTMLPETPLMVTCGGPMLPPLKRAAVSWLAFSECNHPVKSLKMRNFAYHVEAGKKLSSCYLKNNGLGTTHSLSSLLMA